MFDLLLVGLIGMRLVIGFECLCNDFDIILFIGGGVIGGDLVLVCIVIWLDCVGGM